MPISGTRRLTNSRVIPSIDIYDPSLIFYSPLWRPDMVASGGGIVNGTGTMDVSPQNLAVGANTITVTAAGTFIVYMPEGGSVASGTMTVTGSPVTVSAGIATTITTTGATGTITCTPSNIIRSKDKNIHAMTITGTAWQGNSGRYFDGIDDKMLCGDINALDGLTKITAIAWVKIDGAGSGVAQDIFIQKQTGFALGMGWTADKIDFYIHDGAWKTSGSSSMTITDSAWHYCVGVYDNNTISVYVDLVLGNSNAIGATTLTSSAELVSLGCTAALPSTYTNFLKGNIGEVFAYNRALSVAEFTNIRLATKGRYI